MNENNIDSQHKALEELSRKVAHATKPNDETQKLSVDNNGMGLGMRMASEFASAILVGALMGFGIDNWLKTKPWALIIGLGFGFAAGVVNIVRVAKAYAKDKPLGQDLPPETDNDPDAK